MYPTHYWQGAAWNVAIPDLNDLQPAARPRLHDDRHMRTFIDRYKLDQLTAGEKKSNAGFSLHDGKDSYIYCGPKECEFIGVRLPKDAKGKSMTGIWFNPFDGTFSEPVVEKISQWPAFAVPDGDGFRILIVEIVK